MFYEVNRKFRKFKKIKNLKNKKTERFKMLMKKNKEI
jgi:hypothetical protein